MIEDRENRKPRKWYTNYTFPLVPVIGHRKADEYNTFGWDFHWMFFRVWTRDAFDFEIALTIDTHWGIGVTALLPYLRVVIAIPCPEWLAIKIQKYLWRKPKQLNIKEFPFEIKDKNGNEIYWENSNGDWCRKEYDSYGNEKHFENSNGFIEDRGPKDGVVEINTTKEMEDKNPLTNPAEQQNQREMTRIIIEAEFEIDDVWCANSKDQEEKEWFWDELIPSCMVILHSNEVGDTISHTDAFTIKQITFNTKER